MDLLREYISDNVKELGLLTVDLVLYGISHYSYNKYRHNISCIQESRRKGENVAYAYNELESNRTYGLVKGTVTPVGQPLTSLFDNSIAGVAQKLTISAHYSSRTRFGFWEEYKRVLHEKTNASPFCLVNEKFKIAVQDVLYADKLDMSITYDQFEPSSVNVMDLILIIASGSRQKGIQTTEEMLKVGAVVSVIGDIVVAADSSYTVVAPKDKPFYVISDSVHSLLASLESGKTLSRVFCVLFGCVAAAIVFHSGRHIYAEYRKKRADEARDRRLRETRHTRRAAVRDKAVAEELRCVICQSNEREIVLLPCGHFCVCEDCNESLQSLCPMCRTPIVERVPTYL